MRAQTESPEKSFEAAKTLCELSNWSITNLKVQKLLYLANMFFLGKNDSSLTDENFQAWQYGPILPSVYDELKIFGASIVKDVFYNTGITENKDITETLEETWNLFGDKDDWELVMLTHRAGGGWCKNYVPGKKKVISKNDILREYRVYGQQ